jgi:hypothetical protein
VTFFPVESITVGLYVPALSIITVFVAVLLLDTIRGSTLGSGIRALNSVEVETANGTANGGKSLLSLIKAIE